MPRSSFAGFRFPPEVITVAVRWHLRYGLSYRDVEELLAERGIKVGQHLPVGAALHAAACADSTSVPYRVGDRWRVDETYVKVSGRWR